MVKQKEIEETNRKLEIENEELMKLKDSLKTKIDKEIFLLIYSNTMFLLKIKLSQKVIPKILKIWL